MKRAYSDRAEDHGGAHLVCRLQGMERPSTSQRFEGGQENREDSRDLSILIHADETLAKSQEVECGQ